MHLFKGKKLLALVLSLILVAFVASCAPTARDTDTTTTEAAVTTTEAEEDETTTTEAEEETTTEAEEETTTEEEEEETTTTEAEEEATTTTESEEADEADEDDADADASSGAALSANGADATDEDTDEESDATTEEDAEATTTEEDSEVTTEEDAEATTTEADEDEDDGGKRVIRIGVVGEANEPWEAAKENLKDEDFEIELVRFSEYILPNEALVEGEIELNSFQHRMFLENEIESEGYEIEEIGVTILAPLTVYSEKYDSMEDIPEDSIIAIPSDPTNGGRALKLLETAGLLMVDPEAGYLGTEADITDNPLNLEILAVEASMTAQSLPDVAAAIINGHHASTHGLSPEADGLFTEEIDDDPDNPFINVIVARSDEVDDEDYKKIVEAFQQPNVAEVILEAYKGTQIPAWPNAMDAEDVDDESTPTPTTEEGEEGDPQDEDATEEDSDATEEDSDTTDETDESETSDSES